MRRCGIAGKEDADTDLGLLAQYSDAVSRVVAAETNKLRCDRQHELEARRLSSLLKEVAQNKGFITKEHVMQAAPYFSLKSRAEGEIVAAVERVREVRTGAGAPCVDGLR